MRSELDAGGRVVTEEEVYTHGDSQANRVFTDRSGRVVQATSFTAFGGVRSGSDDGSLTGTDDLWNGGDELPEIGVTLLGPRAYDPALGRFLQRDPIAVLASSSHGNPYAFSFSDPENLSDPSGLCPEGVCPSGFTVSPGFLPGPSDFGYSSTPGLSVPQATLPSGYQNFTTAGTGPSLGLGPFSATGTSSTEASVEGVYDAKQSFDQGVSRGATNAAVGLGKGLYHAASCFGDLKCQLNLARETVASGPEQAAAQLQLALDCLESMDADCASRTGETVGDVGFNLALAFVPIRLPRFLRPRAVQVATPKPLGLCFAKGTPVATAAGLVAIEMVRSGDQVWAEDERTGEISLRRVVRTFVTQRQPLVEVRVDGDGDHPAETILATPRHPFWTLRGWIAAGALRADDRLLTVDQQWRHVLGVAVVSGEHTVYNFEVEHDHTYFVGTGAYLVHNTSAADIRTAPRWKPRRTHRLGDSGLKDHALRHSTLSPPEYLAQGIENVRSGRMLRGGGRHADALYWIRRLGPDDFSMTITDKKLQIRSIDTWRSGGNALTREAIERGLQRSGVTPPRGFWERL